MIRLSSELKITLQRKNTWFIDFLSTILHAILSKENEGDLYGKFWDFI